MTTSAHGQRLASSCRLSRKANTPPSRTLSDARTLAWRADRLEKKLRVRRSTGWLLKTFHTANWLSAEAEWSDRMVSRLHAQTERVCVLSKSEPVTGPTTSRQSLRMLNKLNACERLSVEPSAFCVHAHQKKKNQVVLKPKTISALFSGQSASGRAIAGRTSACECWRVLSCLSCPEKRQPLRLPKNAFCNYRNLSVFAFRSVTR